MAEDDWQAADPDTLSLEDVHRAGIKDLSELLDFSVGDDGDWRVHAWHFRSGGRLTLRYEGERLVSYVAEGLRFERLGSRIFVSAEPSPGALGEAPA